MKIKPLLAYFGAFVFLVGTLGFFVWGPAANDSVFGERLFYSPWENWLLMILGAVLFILALVFAWRVLRWVALITSGLFVFVGVYVFFSGQLWRLVLQRPLDGIIYLLLAAYLLGVAIFTKRPQGPGAPGGPEPLRVDKGRQKI